MAKKQISHNYYEILDIRPNARASEIREAYKKAKQTYSLQSPALYSMFTEDEARQILNMVEEAYSVLSQMKKRSRYDQLLLIQTHPADMIEKPVEPMDFIEKEQTLPVEEVPAASYETYTGSVFREIRELKNLELKDISLRTKISTKYLKAIEADDFPNLPARVFVYGYVKEIIRMLNLDLKPVLESYMMHYQRNIVE